ncbi:MAG: hypothetical protein JO026_03515 [Patescibacteria group bacterium]|nr:hypothetical protein [Patescibacteria group bacterium]
MARADTTVTNLQLEQVMLALIPLVSEITKVLAAFALLGFFWGGTMFIWNAGNEKKREQGKYVFLWGIIGFFVLLTIDGIVATLQNTFSLGGLHPIIPPSADISHYNVGNAGGQSGNPPTDTGGGW